MANSDLRTAKPKAGHRSASATELGGVAVDLFGNPHAAAQPAKKAAGKNLEVHEHIFITGPRANGCFIWAQQKTTSHFSHSHEGGDVPHSHPDTGPACYVIDKDDWFRTTGLHGGGRKVLTAAPSGEQMPRVELEKWQTEFEIIVGPPPKVFIGEGPGIALPARMILACGMKVAALRGDDGPAQARGHV